MDHTTFTIWDPTQPNAKMKIINIAGEAAPTQFIETVNSAPAEQIILQTHDGRGFLMNENEIGRIDQIPPENLIYMAADDGSLIQGEVVHVQPEEQQHHHQQQTTEEYMECEVTEEVITDDWVQTDGQECVQVTVDQLGATAVVGAEDDLTVPLPTDQDEYTASRPYPCDFCSRRFRKKVNLMNHMVAHSNANDRPHMCKLCGARYMRRCDLLNHLKLHAYVPDDSEEPIRSDPEDDFEYNLSEQQPGPVKRRSPSIDDESEDLLIPAPAPYKPPKPARSKARPKASVKSHKKSSTSSSAARARQVPPQTESKFNASIESFVNLPPRYPVLDDRKPFVCQKCGVSFAREKALASHYRIHGGDSQYECETCGDRFWDRSLLQDHIRQRHAASLVAAAVGPPQLESSAGGGGATIVEEVTADVHEGEAIQEAIDDGKWHPFCDSCGMVFQRQEQLKRHIKQAHGVAEQKHEPISQIVRQRQLNQQKRLAEQDDDEEKTEDSDSETDDGDEQYVDDAETQSLSCNVCGQKFAEALDLLAHAEIHARFEPHKCSLCKRSFLDETTIKEHVQQFHSLELTETSCVVCGKLCKNHNALLKHAWEHSRERASYGTHCCSKCGKSFHNKARLKRHMVSHRNKTVRCEVCSEEFPDGRSLMNHRHSHTKSRQFPCHECGKTFGSRSSQQIHLRIHSGERPYGCRFCWKAFADGGTLRKHERVHTGEKPYGCSVCPRAFNQRVVLREHIRSHHSAPDLKRGTQAEPYYCSVCTALFGTSMDLIQHLIQHSDANTAMKRQPPTFPRKYKRRKKMKADELDKAEQSGGSSRSKKKVNEAYVESDHGGEEDEDLLKNPAEILLEYGAGNSNRKLIASPKFIDSYELLASASASRGKPPALDDSGINLLSNVVLVNSSESGNAEKKYKPIKTESPKRRHHGGSGTAGSTPSGSRPRMIHTQKTRVAATDGKRKTKTVITKDVKSQPLNSSAEAFPALEFKRARNRSVPTYREIPSDKISSESFPLLDDGQEEDEDPQEDQAALDALSNSTTQRRQQEVPSYEDLLNQNLLMEISRKDKYMDKFNSDIVNDLEEILRSPVKSSTSHLPPADIMATPKATSQYNGQPEYDGGTTSYGKSSGRKSSRKQQFKKTIKDSSCALTTELRSQRLTRRQLEREVNFLREAYNPADYSQVTVKQEKDSPDKLSAMLLNDIQPAAFSSAPPPLMNPKLEREPSPEPEPPAPAPPPPQLFQCEMCSAVFQDRSQLLLHVPIHI
uniref:Putative mudr-1x ap n=1 Tax=Culex tarsalis TaxID=7177 RepID=A0A1Q3F2I0_CULTA